MQKLIVVLPAQYLTQMPLSQEEHCIKTPSLTHVTQDSRVREVTSPGYAKQILCGQGEYQYVKVSILSLSQVMRDITVREVTLPRLINQGSNLFRICQANSVWSGELPLQVSILSLR